MQPPPTRRELVSISDYAARTGISETEIRRQIRAGKLPAEKFDRPQGSYYRIVVDTPDDTPPAAEQEPPTSQDAPAPATEPPAAITALVDALADERSERQRLAADLLAATERAGRAETDASHERARAADLAERLAAAESEARELALALEREQRRSWLDRLLGRWPV
jgi:hypothetical protein